MSVALVRANSYAVLTAILALSVGPAWFSSQQLVVEGDVLRIHYPWFVLWRDALATGEFPFWNPYSFGGIPAFATLQAGYGYPPHWLLTPLPPILALNWLIGLHVLLAGLGTAWAAGRMGSSRSGQVVAGLAYALGSAMVARMWAGHLSFLEANAWLPLATGLAVDVRSRRRVVFLAPVTALMTLAGQPEVVIFTLWWLPLWAALAARRDGWRAVLVALLRTGLAVGLGGALSAFQMLPVLELLSISNRQARMEWDFRTAASLPPWHLFELFQPLAFGDPRGSYWSGFDYEWHERLLYVGSVPLVAAVALSGRWRWPSWALAGLAVAFAFGGYVPWYQIVELLPGYANLRIPSKHLVLAALALALAAGLGLDRLQGRRAATLTVVLAFVVLIVGGALAIWVPPAASMLGGSEYVTSQSRLAMQNAPWLPIVVTVVVLLLASVMMRVTSSATRRAALLLLTTAELVLVLQPFRLHPSDPSQIVQLGSALRGYERVAPIGDGTAVLANYGPVLRVQQPGGYVSLFSGEYMTLLTGRSNAKVEIEAQRDALPILALLGYEATAELRGGRASVQGLRGGPRAWVARCVWPGGAREVRERDFPRQSCVTRPDATSRQPVMSPGSARIVGEGLNWLTVESDGPGWLVTSRSWYPGWYATSEIGSVRVEPVDGALVGAALPDGPHTVTLRYWPAGLTFGLAISALAALATVVLTCFGDRRPDSSRVQAVGSSKHQPAIRSD